MELLAYEDPDFALTEALETDPIVMRELVEGRHWPYPLARKGSCCSSRTPLEQRGLSMCGRGHTMTNRIRRTSFAQRG